MSRVVVIRIVNIITAIFFMIVSLTIFSGCVSKDRLVTTTVYQDVFIPVPCDLPEPEGPIKQKDVLLAIIELKDYSQRLLSAFKACKGALSNE